MLCECCGMKEAETKDYREAEWSWGKYYVCWGCLNRTNNSFRAKRANMLKRQAKCIV